jgi:hypothetical protein
MKTTFHENPYAIDDGRFLAKFKGIEPFQSENAVDKNGNKLPPGWKWEFTLCEGPHAGKIANIITPNVPTLKNKCGRMIMAVSDGVVRDGMEFDSDTYRGNYYRITIREGIISDSPPPSFVGTQRPSQNILSDAGNDAAQRGVGSGNKGSDEPIPF